MTHDAESAERPARWAEFEGMGFVQLYRLIDRSADRLSDPEASVEDGMPGSREELTALCDLLRDKAEEVKRDNLIPEAPVYDGPEHPGPFVPSPELRSLYNKQGRYEREVDRAEGGSRIVYEWCQDQLEKMVEREVAPAERREKREHAELVEEYRQAHDPYWESYMRWESEARRRRDAEDDRDRIVRRMYRKAGRVRASGRMSALPFELAAPGEGNDEHIRGYYRGVLRQRRLDGFDQDRFDKMLALPRSNWKRGTAGKYGYIVLMFAHTEKVLLECPIRDNAIYVLDSGEERLLKMDKQELIASNEVKRIFHTGDWYVRLKRELEIADPSPNAA